MERELVCAVVVGGKKVFEVRIDWTKADQAIVNQFRDLANGFFSTTDAERVLFNERWDQFLIPLPGSFWSDPGVNSFTLENRTVTIDMHELEC